MTLGGARGSGEGVVRERYTVHDRWDARPQHRASNVGLVPRPARQAAAQITVPFPSHSLFKDPDTASKKPTPSAGQTPSWLWLC
jgi:hypothetical protein